MAIVQKRYARRSLFKAAVAAVGAVVAAKLALRDQVTDAASVQSFDRAVDGGDLTSCVITLPENHGFTGALIMHEGVNDVGYETMFRGLSEWKGGRARAFPAGTRVMEFGPFELNHDHTIRIDGQVIYFPELT